MLTPGCLFARGTILKTMFPHSIIFLINEDDYVAIREITALDTHDIIKSVEQGTHKPCVTVSIPVAATKRIIAGGCSSKDERLFVGALLSLCPGDTLRSIGPE